jgi:hypothetical protein
LAASESPATKVRAAQAREVVTTRFKKNPTAALLLLGQWKRLPWPVGVPARFDAIPFQGFPNVLPGVPDINRSEGSGQQSLPASNLRDRRWTLFWGLRTSRQASLTSTSGRFRPALSSGLKPSQSKADAFLVGLVHDQVQQCSPNMGHPNSLVKDYFLQSRFYPNCTTTGT